MRNQLIRTGFRAVVNTVVYQWLRDTILRDVAIVEYAQERREYI